MREGSARGGWLARAPTWAFAAYAGSVAFATYFCMYAFRKPFAAAAFADGHRVLGLEPKTAYVVAQIVGYTISKFVGVKVCSEIAPEKRGRALLLLIGVAEIALLGFALAPPSLRPLAMLMNGLPLGMVWGLVVARLEGRRTSELLLAILSCSFIVSSGAVKDVGRWTMQTLGASETWMPFTTGLLFLPPFVLAVLLLDRIPPPTAEDAAERTERVPMDAGARMAFVRRLFPGLAMLFVVYAFMTAFRDFRDNYGAEVFAELGYGKATAIFTRTEVPVAIGVMVALGALMFVRDNRRGLRATFAIMLAGAALLGISTALLDLGLLGGATWMLAIGLGSYLVYVPFNSVLFDRLIAHTRIKGTAVFAIYVADSLGYTASIGVQVERDLGASMGRLAFLRGLTYFTAVLAVVLLLASAFWFDRFARSRGSRAPGIRDPGESSGT